MGFMRPKAHYFENTEGLGCNPTQKYLYLPLVWIVTSTFIIMNHDKPTNKQWIDKDTSLWKQDHIAIGDFVFDFHYWIENDKYPH
jgi:hypothetical protein